METSCHIKPNKCFVFLGQCHDRFAPFRKLHRGLKASPQFIAALTRKASVVHEKTLSSLVAPHSALSAVFLKSKILHFECGDFEDVTNQNAKITPRPRKALGATLKRF